MTSFFVHEMGICESARVGERTRIWAFAHVLPGAVIGADCNICDGVFVENDVVIGDRVTIKSGVQIWDGVHIADDAFIGPNATFSNDRHPRSRQWRAEPERTWVGERASIGANATILPGVTVGTQAMVGAGAVVTKDVPAHAIVAGNPARIRGYVDAESPASSSRRTNMAETAPDRPDLPGGCTLIPLASASDLRGNLSAMEFDAGMPFTPRRFFTVYGVPSAEVRGEHAHRRCQQILIAASGSISVLLDDGHRRAQVDLDSPLQALHMPAMVWGSQFRYSADAVLAVLASEPYSPADYIRSYDEFVRLVDVR